MADYHRPKNRPGHTITAVWWNRDGTLRWVKYEKTAKATAPETEIAGTRPQRGLLAAERANRAAKQPSLFDGA